MWYILNYIPSGRNTRANLPRLVNRFSASRPGNGLELFAPLFYTVENGERGPRRVERPLLYHYIFIRGEERLVKELCNTHEGFSFILDHAGSERYLTVADDTMEAFRLMARTQGNRLECYSPEDIDLQEGDKVQVVTGEFAGLTGTYLPRKGGRTGNIVVQVTQKLGAVVYDINADCVRVLEFAPTTRRPYDQMDAYIPRLLNLLRDGESRDTATTKLTTPAMASAVVFTRRFGTVRIGNPKVDAKLQLMLYASYKVLGQMEEAARTLKRYQTLAANITNVWTRLLCHLVFGLLNADADHLRRGRELLSTLPSTTHRSAIQTTIARLLQDKLINN